MLSYWQSREDARGPLSRLEGDSADVIVVGGGFAGLATAIRIKELHAGTDVLLLEAERIGYGASGRNGGLLSPLAAPLWLVGARWNPDQAWGLRRLNAAMHDAAAWLKSRVPEAELTSMPLALEATGRLTRSGLTRVSETLAHLGLPHTFDRRAGRRGAGTLTLDAHVVQPAAMAHGLARRARELGCRVVEGIKVEAIEAVGGGAVVRLADQRRIRGRSIVVATNAYTAGLSLPCKVAGRAVYNFMLATEPLEDAVLARLAAEPRFTVELNAAYVFHRIHDRRLVLGGIDKLVNRGGDESVPAKVEARLRRLMAASVPTDAPLAVASTWAGRFHATHTELPIIRRDPAHPGIILNVGYGGTGVALTQITASAVARLALGEPLEPDEARLLQLFETTRLPLIEGARMIGKIVRGAVADR